MSDPVHVKGLENLLATLQQFPGKYQEHTLVRAMSAGTAIMQAEMIARAPVRDDGRGGKKLGKRSTKARLPGYLKASISRRRVNKGSGDSVTYEVGVSRKAFYASFYEFGTRHQHPRAFIRPAAEATSEAVVEKMAEVSRNELEKGADLGLKS